MRSKLKNALSEGICNPVQQQAQWNQAASRL